MIEGLPSYVSWIFILTTILTVGIFGFTVRSVRLDNLPAPHSYNCRLILVSFSSHNGDVRGLSDHGRSTAAVCCVRSSSYPSSHRLYFVFFRKEFIEVLPIKYLTLIHIVRIPVELVLLWLYQAGLEPRLMTFEGWNFDILSGLTAPVVYYFAFSSGKTNRPLLIVWNIFALGLLINVVTIAVLTSRSPMQKLSLDQPNIGVTYFPFIWLPTIIVPIVLFSHLTSLWKLLKTTRE
jgi:hypothetical protein